MMGAVEEIWLRETLSVMMVLSTAVPAFESVVVLPARVIFLETTSVDVHVAVPAGTTTVSPTAAAVTAELTSANEGLLALMVAPSDPAWPASNTAPPMRRPLRQTQPGLTL